MTDIPDNFMLRIGRVSIPKFIIDDNPRAIMAAFADGIVVRCECAFQTGGLDYVLFHTEFDPVNLGEMPPHYECLFQMHSDRTVTHEWKRVT